MKIPLFIFLLGNTMFLSAGETIHKLATEDTKTDTSTQNYMSRRPTKLNLHHRPTPITITRPKDFTFDDEGNLQEIHFEKGSPLAITGNHLRFKKSANNIDWIITFPDGRSLACPLGTKSKFQLQVLQRQYYPSSDE